MCALPVSHLIGSHSTTMTVSNRPIIRDRRAKGSRRRGEGRGGEGEGPVGHGRAWPGCAGPGRGGALCSREWTCRTTGAACLRAQHTPPPPPPNSSSYALPTGEDPFILISDQGGGKGSGRGEGLDSYLKAWGMCFTKGEGWWTRKGSERRVS